MEIPQLLEEDPDLNEFNNLAFEEYIRTRDCSLRNEIFNRNVGLAKSIANKVSFLSKNRNLDFDECFSGACLGLLSVKWYEPKSV